MTLTFTENAEIFKTLLKTGFVVKHDWISLIVDAAADNLNSFKQSSNSVRQIFIVLSVSPSFFFFLTGLCWHRAPWHGSTEASQFVPLSEAQHW